MFDLTNVSLLLICAFFLIAGIWMVKYHENEIQNDSFYAKAWVIVSLILIGFFALFSEYFKTSDVLEDIIANSKVSIEV